MSGVMEEFSLGRFFGAGPVGAFGGAMENGGKSKKLGEGLGACPDCKPPVFAGFSAGYGSAG